MMVRISLDERLKRPCVIAPPVRVVIGRTVDVAAFLSER